MSLLSLEIKLLIVDDDRDLLLLVEKHLVRRHPELHIVAVESAQDALQLIEETVFDAIVCDYYLGPNEMNGLELLEWLRGSGNIAPFVMFTGQGREEVAIRALNLGADFYLKKGEMDFQDLFTELIHHIKRAVSTRRVEEALRRSETRFRAIFQKAPIGVAQVEPDGMIADANQSLIDMLGYSKDELKAMNLSSMMVSPKDGENDGSVTEMIGGTLETSRMERCFLAKNGDEVCAHVSVSLVKGPDGLIQFAIFMIEDVRQQIASEEALKRAESELIASEQQYRHTLDSLGDRIHVVDKDLCIQLLNPSLEKWIEELGMDTKIIGKNLFDVFPFLSGKVENEYNQVFESGETLTTTESNLIDGNLIITETQKVPIISEDDTIQVVTIIRDITESTNIEKDLRFTQFAIDRTSDAAFWMGEDAKFIYVNEATCRSLGYTREELLTMTVHDIDPLFTREIWPEHWIELKEKKSFIIESQHRSKDGKIIPVELRLNFVEFGGKEYNCAFATDLTERRIAEERVEEHRGFLERVIESLTHPFYVIDASNYSIMLANKAARLGPISNAATCYSLTHGDVKPCEGVDHTCPLEEVIETKKPTIVEHTHYDVNGIPRTFMVHGFPIFDDQGEVVQMIEYNLDVTEQRDAVEQLRAQKEELSRFAHQMSHDFSNYLLKIDGATTELAMDFDKIDTHQVHQLIREMRELLKHSVSLADAGLVIEKKEVVDLGQLLSILAKSHIPDTIEVQQDSLPLIRADKTKLMQVFQNLFDNAVKHGNPSKVEIRYKDIDDHVMIIVHNNGLPFPEDVRSRINSGRVIIDQESRGFGLDIVRRIVGAHGWSIELLEGPLTALAITIPSSEIA